MHRSVANIALVVLAATAAGSQEPRAPQLQRGVIVGEVVDAATLQPLSGATVVLRPASGGALPPPSRSGTAFLAEAWSVVTSASGGYRFEDLSYGSYQLRVQRIGYRPVTVDVQLSASVDARFAPPPDGELAIRFDERPAAGNLEIATGDDDRAAAQVVARAGSEMLLVLPGELRVRNSRALTADYRVTLPYSLRRVRLYVGQEDARPRIIELAPGSRQAIPLAAPSPQRR